jgi:hypothetical protein
MDYKYLYKKYKHKYTEIKYGGKIIESTTGTLLSGHPINNNNNIRKLFMNDDRFDYDKYYETLLKKQNENLNCANISYLDMENVLTNLKSNNYTYEEIQRLQTFSEVKYVKEIYFESDNKSLQDKLNELEIDFSKLYDLFNLIYKPYSIKGISTNLYPYGPSELYDFLSLTNNSFILNKNNILKYEKSTNKYSLNNLLLEDNTFYEIIRFEKIPDIETYKKTQFVLQDKFSELSTTSGFVLKGIYYYPCIGSGIFIKSIKSFYAKNKLDAITKLHEELREQKSNLDICTDKSDIYYDYSNFANNYNILKIESNKLIKLFIKELTVGFFNINKSISLSLLKFYINNVKQFNILLEKKLLKYLYKIYKDNEDIIYEFYRKTFMGLITIDDYFNIKKEEHKSSSEDKKFISYLQTKLKTTYLNDYNKILNIFLQENKDIFIYNNYYDKYKYLFLYFRNKLDKLLDDNHILIITNLLFELYSDIYDANFNQIFLDATMYFYAEQLQYDTIILTHEPSDKIGYFGTEIIVIEDLQIDSFVRTILLKQIKPDILHKNFDNIINYLKYFL